MRARSSVRSEEKTRSWKRCSVASSKSKPRTKSLESGMMSCRLNHELLPEPGSPIARTTAPFAFFCFCGAGCGSRDGAGAGTPSAAAAPSNPTSAASPVARPGFMGSVGPCCGGAAGCPLPPRPRLPRRRERSRRMLPPVRGPAEPAVASASAGVSFGS